MSLMSLSVMSQSLMNSLSAMFSMKSTCLVFIFLLPGVFKMPTQEAGGGSTGSVRKGSNDTVAVGFCLQTLFEMGNLPWQVKY